MLNRKGKPALLPMLMLFLSISTGIFAQAGYKSEEELIKSAERFFSEKNYERAFPLYSQIVSNRPDNSYYNYCLGVCIMKAGTDKAEAIRFLDIATKSPQNPSDSWLYLGNAYHQSYRYEEAIAAYENFKLNGGRSSWNNAKGDLLIKMCRNGITMKNDLSMNRHRILEKAEIEGADFYTLYKNLNDWGRFLKLPKEYEDKNTKERPESAYLFLATKGNVMMYANSGKSSDRGFDVFKVIKDQKGLWTFPEALAEIINTSGDEAFPVIINEGKTIFFSSRGDRSTGGYDVFRSDLNEGTGTWSEPVSLGPPVNSPADDYYYLPSADNSIAYFASNRESSGTKCHVYKASIIREDRNFVAISGLFNCVAGLDLSDAKVTILDPENRAIVAEFRTPSQQGDYHLKLPAGNKYIYQVELVGFNSQEQLVDLAAYSSLDLIQEIMLVRTDQGKEVMNITNRVPVKSDVVAQNNEQKLLQVGAAPGGVESRMATRNSQTVNAVSKENEEMVLASAQPVSDKTTGGSNTNVNSNTQTTKNNPATAENVGNLTAISNSGNSAENSKTGSINSEPTATGEQKSATNTSQTNNQSSSKDDVNNNGVALKSDGDKNNNVVTPKSENVSENNAITNNESVAEKNTASGTKTNESGSQVKNIQTVAVKNTESKNGVAVNESKNANAESDLNATEGTAQVKVGTKDANLSSEKSNSQNTNQPEAKQIPNEKSTSTETEPLVAVVSTQELNNNNAGKADQPASETQQKESKPANSDVAANSTSTNKNLTNSTSDNSSSALPVSNVTPGTATAEKPNSSPASSNTSVPASENESSKKSSDVTGTDAMAQQHAVTPSEGTNNQAVDASVAKNNTTTSSQNTKAVSSHNENPGSTQSNSVDHSEQAVSVNSTSATSSEQGIAANGKSTGETGEDSRVNVNQKNNEAVAETNKSNDAQKASVDNSDSQTTKPSESSNDKNIVSENNAKGGNSIGNSKGNESISSSAKQTEAGTKSNSATSATKGSDVANNQVAATNSNTKSTESTTLNNAEVANKNGSVNSGTENADVKKNSSNDVNSNSNVEQSGNENSATSYVLPADPATNETGTTSTESNSGSPITKNQTSTPAESEGQAGNANSNLAANQSNVNNSTSETGSNESAKADQKNKKKGNGLFGRKKQDDTVAEQPVADLVVPDADSLTKAEAALYKNLVFRVQLGAYKDRSVEDLKKKFEAMGLKDLVYVKNEVGLLLVMTGSESSYEAALALKADMIGKGVADAFIVVYSEGARLPVQMVVQPAE
jgi:tetratricopeptide (TPR) repeat protein